MPGEPILIVDDTPINLKLTRILLEHQGYEVRTANGAEEALQVLESFHPRLVLADIQMPGVDGLEMTRRIKQDPRNADTPGTPPPHRFFFATPLSDIWRQLGAENEGARQLRGRSSR